MTTLEQAADLKRIEERGKALGVTDDVSSPCIGICVLDPATGWCKGCFRTIDEIADWTRLGPAGRRAVVDAAKARRPPPVGQGEAVKRKWR